MTLIGVNVTCDLYWGFSIQTADRVQAGFTRRREVILGPRAAPYSTIGVILREPN